MKDSPKKAEDRFVQRLEAGDRLVQRLEHARAVGTALSKETDALNKALDRAAKALADLNLGVSAAVDITDPEMGSTTYFEQIAFRKTEGAWQLVFVNGDQQTEMIDITPLLKTSRETRFRAAEVLPELVDALIVNAEKQLELAKGHVERTNGLIEKLEEAPF